MKLRIVILSLLFVAFVPAQERVFPGAMAHLNMLSGQWLVEGGGWVRFQYDHRIGEMIGSAKQNRPGAQWKRMTRIYPEGQPTTVKADFYNVSGNVTHYHLVSSDTQQIQFANEPVAGAPLLELSYTKLPGGRVKYRFERDHRLVESGTMSPTANIQPLSPTLIQPLSE